LIGLPRETERLRLRAFTFADAPFLLELHSDPDFLRFVGDRGVRDLETAHTYLRDRILGMYEAHGFGLWLVERKDDATPVGLNGLIRREGLADVDIGFAFLPVHRGRGYALESSRAVLDLARERGIERVVAITTPDNVRSEALLAKLSMAREGTVSPPGDPIELHLHSVRLETT